jgi:protein tyrosine phosphatase (PTP) superfamily phosphohydrolase (DUF442 family)
MATPSSEQPLFAERLALAGRWANMLVKDHAFIRLLYLNRHKLGEGVYRAAQPTPGQLRAMAERWGLRTVINLRGARPECGSYFFETRICARYGLRLIDLPVRSRDAPRPDDLWRALEAWQAMQRPALMHCKAGADRVGFMSVYYRFAMEGEPLEQAMRQLSWRYGHLSAAKTGILGCFWRLFQASGGRTLDDFKSWLTHDYDQATLRARFAAGRWSSLLADGLLRRE